MVMVCNGEIIGLWFGFFSAFYFEFWFVPPFFFLSLKCSMYNRNQNIHIKHLTLPTHRTIDGWLEGSRIHDGSI